ncbi:hypothetical protein PN36_11035 [Candidatus Thiomargarita nelsonii]|uniref:Uncharacterized protein n=1 Tax=Candidatus Thiomargarita nelsonii TaxID=1003181 RepID=A0A0A6P8Y2_9GAMM|nr:hypothetical protein PN36_11035 [Candidatus Thiomargarita nelsonii]
MVALKELEDLFVLSLWSTYERFVRIYLQQKGATLQTTKPTNLAAPMYEYFCDELPIFTSGNDCIAPCVDAAYISASACAQP